MKKLAIILPRGESIKNFVYSGITDALRSHFQITFFSVVPNKEIKEYLMSKCDNFYELKDSNYQNTYAKEIKKILETVISEENKRKPHTDDKLSLLLKEEGYPIARRTVAKYREQLDIPVARLRKEF